jgi:hypothetical protein
MVEPFVEVIFVRSKIADAWHVDCNDTNRVTAPAHFFVSLDQKCVVLHFAAIDFACVFFFADISLCEITIFALISTNFILF